MSTHIPPTLDQIEAHLVREGSPFRMVTKSPNECYFIPNQLEQATLIDKLILMVVFGLSSIGVLKVCEMITSLL